MTNRIGKLVGAAMDTLINKANQGGRYSIQENKQHWEWDLYSPTKELHSESGNSNENNDNEVEKYPFEYKTWIKSDKNIFEKWFAKTDSLQPLDLDDFDRTKNTTKVKKPNQLTERENNPDGLTVDDIRGAVGGSESIPGFSSSAAATETQATSSATPAASKEVPNPSNSTDQTNATISTGVIEPDNTSAPSEKSNESVTEGANTTGGIDKEGDIAMEN